MNIRNEIAEHAAEEDRAALFWLFDRYHMASQWRFVARSSFVRYGVESYAVRRVWAPTAEGRAIFEALAGTKQRPSAES